MPKVQLLRYGKLHTASLGLKFANYTETQIKTHLYVHAAGFEERANEALHTVRCHIINCFTKFGVRT